jgi:uncharacterized protein YceK
MNGKSRSSRLSCLLPSIFFLAGCASYTGHRSQPNPPQTQATYVYVQASATGYAGPSHPTSTLAFSAAADGALTPNPPLSSQAAQQNWIAVQGRSIYALDSDVIHQYEIRADGTITGPAASVDTQDYGGVSCGHASGGAVIDRTGQYLTVELYSAQGDNGGALPYYPCDAWQTFAVQANGGFQFEGFGEDDQPDDHLGVSSLNLLTVSGNSQFAYGVVGSPYADSFGAMTRDSTGTLRQSTTFTSIDPAPDPAGEPDDHYFPKTFAGDSSNHLAVAVTEAFTLDPALWNVEWLAIYTIDPSTSRRTPMPICRSWGRAQV